MSVFEIALLPGDGIGPEVIRQAVGVLETAGKKYGVGFAFHEAMIGGCAIDAAGDPLPKETVDLCKRCDAVLLGAVGGPKWDNLPGGKRPEAGLLGIRARLELFANLRPAVIYPALKDASPLKAQILAEGVDILVVRELTGGMYFGEKGRKNTAGRGEAAYDTEMYSTGEIERIARVGFEAALKRRGNLVSVDKANVLESSRLWREVVTRTALDYPDVSLSHMYVDNAAMQLVRRPSQFDVIVTSNMFGDILSDEASIITGSIGMLPSASLGYGRKGLYEPVHGSAPDIAGTGRANPLAAILSASMMLKYSFGLDDAAKDIEAAVGAVLEKGFRTADIMSEGLKPVDTEEMGRLVGKEVEKSG